MSSLMNQIRWERIEEIEKELEDESLPSEIVSALNEEKCKLLEMNKACNRLNFLFF
jgi:hypothetical protein